MLTDDLLNEWRQLSEQGYEVVFMGSSMGGFTAEYLAMKTGAKAVMINPAIAPSELLPQFIGVAENYETGEPYQWNRKHCEQYLPFERELAASDRTLDRTILLDKADALLDAEKTAVKYQGRAEIVRFEGGSHGFEHMREALPAVERVLFG